FSPLKHPTSARWSTIRNFSNCHCPGRRHSQSLQLHFSFAQCGWRHVGKAYRRGGSFSDAVYYDGGVLSGPSSQNDGQYNPSVDAIAEFKLISDDYSAEYGHALAGITSFTLKSGTNSLHGSAFEFFRNEKMDARGFFAASKAPTRQNEFGGTIGGP